MEKHYGVTQLPVDVWTAYVVPLLSLETLLPLRRLSSGWRDICGREILSRLLAEKWREPWSKTQDAEEGLALASWRLGILSSGDARVVAAVFDGIVGRTFQQTAETMALERPKCKDGMNADSPPKGGSSKRAGSARKGATDLGDGSGRRDTNQPSNLSGKNRVTSNKKKGKRRDSSSDSPSEESPRTSRSKQTPVPTLETRAIMKLDLLVEETVTQDSGEPPQKWTLEYTEWTFYDPESDGLGLQEAFRRLMAHNRGQGVLSKTRRDWEDNKEFLLRDVRRLVAICWAVALRKGLRFTQKENRERDERRQSRFAAEAEIAAAVLKPSPRLSGEQMFERAIHSGNIVTVGRYGFDERASEPMPEPEAASERVGNDWNEGSDEEDFAEDTGSLGDPALPPPPTAVREHPSRDSKSTGGDPLHVLLRFLRDTSPSARVLRFPPGMTSRERKRVHLWTRKVATGWKGWGLVDGKGTKSMSFGEGPERFVVIVKDGVDVKMHT